MVEKVWRKLLHCWWECKLVQPLWKTVWRFLKKLKIELPHELAIPLLGTYPDKIIIRKDTCTPLLIGMLFTTAKKRQQPECPQTDEWRRRDVYIYTYMYTHKHTCTHVHTCTQIHMYTHVHVHIPIHIRVHTYIHMCTHTCTHTHMYTYACVHIHAHVHICTHTHVYIQVHTYT